MNSTGFVVYHKSSRPLGRSKDGKRLVWTWENKHYFDTLAEATVACAARGGKGISEEARPGAVLTPLQLASVVDHRDETYWLCDACRHSLEAVVVRPQPAGAPAHCDRCGSTGQ